MIALIIIPLISACMGFFIFKNTVPAHSIGIIGGADGPTSIYMSTYNPNPLPVLWGGVAIMLLLVAIGFVIYRKKRRQ